LKPLITLAVAIRFRQRLFPCRLPCGCSVPDWLACSDWRRAENGKRHNQNDMTIFTLTGSHDD
jgi:hypothetical protein